MLMHWPICSLVQLVIVCGLWKGDRKLVCVRAVICISTIILFCVCVYEHTVKYTVNTFFIC